jgi:demethylmacrocin O-methyltransferase
MWRSYFPRATVYGLDIYEKLLPREPRILLVQGDQSDQVFLAGLAKSYGPFDLIVDDGSHLGRHLRASFAALFPAVRPAGLYVIEDLETAYWDEWEGGPPGTPGTGADLAKSLLDDVNIGPRPVASVHAYRDIVFIERAAVAASPKPQLRRAPAGEVSPSS